MAVAELDPKTEGKYKDNLDSLKAKDRRIAELKKQLSVEIKTTTTVSGQTPSQTIVPPENEQVTELNRMYNAPSAPEQPVEGEQQPQFNPDEENVNPENNEEDQSQDNDNDESDDAITKLKRLRDIEIQNAVAEGAGGAIEGAVLEEGAAAAGASTFPLWGTALAIFLGIAMVFGLFFLIVATSLAYCNASGFGGIAANTISNLSWATGNGDFCDGLSINSISPSSTIIVNPNTPVPPGGGLTDAQARKILGDTNICNYPLGFSRVDCVNAAEPQTSLAGIQNAVINEILSFNLACDAWARNNNRGSCSVVVTGGTETTGGHAGGPCSHLSGNKIDIDDTSEVNSYILTSGNFRRIANRGNDPQYVSISTGNIYVQESNHWDIGGVGCA